MIAELHDAKVQCVLLERQCKRLQLRCRELEQCHLQSGDEGCDTDKLSAVIRAIRAVTDVECVTQGVLPEDLYKSVVNAIRVGGNADVTAMNLEPPNSCLGRGVVVGDMNGLLNEARMHHWNLSRVLQSLHVMQPSVSSEKRM